MEGPPNRWRYLIPLWVGIDGKSVRTRVDIVLDAPITDISPLELVENAVIARYRQSFPDALVVESAVQGVVLLHRWREDEPAKVPLGPRRLDS